MEVPKEVSLCQQFRNCFCSNTNDEGWVHRHGFNGRANGVIHFHIFILRFVSELIEGRILSPHVG